MKYTIELEHLPEAISLENLDKGEAATVAISAFMTEGQGEIFYEILKNTEQSYLGNALASGISTSQISQFLIITRNNLASVYINEPRIIVETIAQRTVQAGERITLHDVMGVRRLTFDNLTIPDDAGIAFFFSVGWRRGFFFDFRPNSGDKLENIYQTLGRHYESLMYAGLHGIEVELWNTLFDLGWFPFLSLIGERQNKLEYLIARIREGKPTESAETQLIESFGENEIENIRQRLEQNPLLNPHISFFNNGIERYLQQDYISCINNIWPRLEGILRHSYGIASRESQHSLLKNMETTLKASSQAYPGIFFPRQFKDYLESYYFRGFNLFAEDVPLSRHTVGHGVSKAEDYDRKRALLGILIADQLGRYVNLSNPSHKETNENSKSP